MTRIFVTTALVGSLILTSCVINEEPSPEWQRAEQRTALAEMAYTNGMAWPSMTGSNEIVMTPGMRITADTPGGAITLGAGEGYERTYTWDGTTRSAKMWPRKTRWLGSLGIYYPGLGQHWKSNHGITRGVLQEGVLWFKTEADAVAWIKKHNSSTGCVYSSQGLVVAWGKVPERKQLNVDVWQIYVDGHKPTRLEGSENDRITVSERK